MNAYLSSFKVNALTLFYRSLSFKDMSFLLRKYYLKICNIENSKQLLWALPEHLAWEQQGQAMPGAERLPLSQENYFQITFLPRCLGVGRLFLLFMWLVAALICRMRLWKIMTGDWVSSCQVANTSFTSIMEHLCQPVIGISN